jgi:plasmid stabilization system protein ParE
MTRPVILRPRAEDDIGAAFEWYESQQAALGEDFLARLRQTLEAIGRVPESSPLIHKSVRRALVVKFPYAVFHVAEPTRVIVLAVLHTSRNPAVWPRR